MGLNPRALVKRLPVMAKLAQQISDGSEGDPEENLKAFYQQRDEWKKHYAGGFQDHLARVFGRLYDFIRCNEERYYLHKASMTKAELDTTIRNILFGKSLAFGQVGLLACSHKTDSRNEIDFSVQEEMFKFAVIKSKMDQNTDAGRETINGLANRLKYLAMTKSLPLCERQERETLAEARLRDWIKELMQAYKIENRAEHIRALCEMMGVD